MGRALHASAVRHRALSLQLQVSAADSSFGILCPCCQVHTHGGWDQTPKQKAGHHAAASLLGPPCSSGQKQHGRLGSSAEAAIRNVLDVIINGSWRVYANCGAGKGFMN